jgi:hypothetical protein
MSVDDPSRRSGASVPVEGADALQRIFNTHFAPDRLSMPDTALERERGSFSVNGWDVRYRFAREGGALVLDVFASHRLTNDRLYRVWADGRVELVGSSSEGVLPEADRAFLAEVARRFM